MIKEVTAQYNPLTIEKEVQEFWDENDVYSKVRIARHGGRKFFFVDGPPYTTGRIHLGTAWNKVIKDTILRYRSMNGYHVLDRAGWDMHGLPIEVKVEGILGFKSKKDIEKFGVDRFISKCKEYAITQKDEMTGQFRKLGVWLNWKDPYMTLRDEYIEAAWWTLKKGHEKNLLEKGLRVVNWCPRCETAIADSEVEYWDEKDPSVYIKFPVIGEENTFIVIWTTTPWTIPANIAVAVHPSFEYSKVKAIKDGKEEILILASELVQPVLRQGRYQGFELIKTMLGEDVTKLSYSHPVADKIPKQKEFSHNVYMADFVTAENTGCVHIAPGHGIDDFELGARNGLPIFCPVGPDGNYTDEAGDYAGMNVKAANPIVIEDLEERNLLLQKGEIVHRYGHCWRCKTSIIYLATEQWFLKVTELKAAMLDEIKKVKWHPDWAGSARFADWVTNSRDWCISRQRYWGIPIPVWVCGRCGSIEVIGTMKELAEKAGMPEGVGDLHRPSVDNIKIRCKCGDSMDRVSDVFDVWFDSAVASWATLRYPAEKVAFDEWWPADFITEGHDQTRGWFYSQLGASMIAFGRAPYKSVLMHGFTLDTEGKKMSKSLGNIVTPESVIEKYGAETLRFYVLYQNAPWEDLKFSWDEVGNIYRMFNVLWNVYRFPLPYMVLDGFDPKTATIDSVIDALRPEDRWILSRTQNLIRTVETAFDGYTLHKAVRAINNFVLEELSRWYIQLIRPRTWRESSDPDKIAAYATIYEVLVSLAKVMAPFAPFVSETMYRNLVRNVDPEASESVHMCDWKTCREDLIDTDLESSMDVVQQIVESASNARQKVKRKLRWPVKRIIIAPASEKVSMAVKSLENILKEQTNAKNIILLEAGQAWDELGVEVVPNPAVIGPAFKKDAGRVIAALKRSDGKSIKQEIEASDNYQLTEDVPEPVTITKDMVSFRETIPETIAASEFPGGTVYVDVELTDEIISEGYAREVIRRLQDMRKELNLQVEEEIDVTVDIQDSNISKLVSTWKDFMAGEVRARSLLIGKGIQVSGTLIKDWDVENTRMKMGITRILRNYYK